MEDPASPLLRAAPLWLAGLAVVKYHERTFSRNVKVPGWVSLTSYVKHSGLSQADRDAKFEANRRNARCVMCAVHRWLMATNSPSPGWTWADRGDGHAKLVKWTSWLRSLDAQEGMILL